MTHAWEDADGKLSPETLITVTFSERGSKTEMIFEQTGFEDPAMRDSHRGGWNQAFDSLDLALVHAGDVQRKTGRTTITQPMRSAS